MSPADLIAPRVEVTRHALGRHWFSVERVRPNILNLHHLSIERVNDGRGFPVLWRLRANGRELIVAQAPITFNGIDPFDAAPMESSWASQPGYTHVLNLTHALGQFE